MSCDDLVVVFLLFGDHEQWGCCLQSVLGISKDCKYLLINLSVRPP